MAAVLLDPASADWPDQIETVRAQLNAAHNSTVFPAHFLRVVLPRIGGHILRLQRGGQTAGIGFLFPRALEAGRRVYTLRGHALQRGVSLSELADAAAGWLPDAQFVLYDPEATPSFHRTSVTVDGWEVGAPSADEAAAIRALQATIWGATADTLYPTDIHSPDFGSVQSLVARGGDQVVAFLFGFYKIGGRPLPPGWDEGINVEWRLESQVLGVHPDLRGRGLATLLKARQAQLARQAGIDIVNWTADPLLWPNALLNFRRLGAVAYNFATDVYTFRNLMNRVPASRLALTWLINSQRARDHLSAAGALSDLAAADAVVVNQGNSTVDLTCDAPRIAIEIPPNWVALQAQSLAEAEAWRNATDAVLSHYIGDEPGKYKITDVARQDGRCYLLASRSL